MPASSQLYPYGREYQLVVFDLRVLNAPERLHSERTAWRENAAIEMLDFDHAVLVIRPGSAWRLAS
jgi:hypothetical protein